MCGRHEIPEVEHIRKPSVQPADVDNCVLMRMDQTVDTGISQDSEQPRGAELICHGVIAKGHTGPRRSGFVQSKSAGMCTTTPRPDISILVKDMPTTG